MNQLEFSSPQAAAARKRILLSMGGKGGVGKPAVMVSLADWFHANQIPIQMLDLDTENKSRGSLTHFYGSQVPKLNIHTPAGAEDALQYAKDHVFERVSVARDHEILAEALRHGRGRIGLDDLKKIIAVQVSSGDILRNGDEIATRASLERERQIIDAVNRGIGVCSRLGGGKPFPCSSHLNPEQRQVVESVLDSHDRSMSIQGAAGTGKTATLQEVRRGLLAAGQSIIALAPTRSAVDELRKVGFKEAVTIERLLQDRGMQAVLGSKVMIVDEAGMVSGRQMAEILRLAELYSARIVFSGDTKQTVVLPWSQFLYADGTNEKIQIAFSTHDIAISGYALGSLLEGLA